MGKEQILKRMAEIAEEILKDDANIEALEKEANELRASLEKIEKRDAILKGINEGTIEGRKINQPNTEKRDFSNMGIDEVLAAPEYRSAFFKNLQGKSLTDAEQRALSTAANSAGSAVPTTTMNMVVDKLRQTSVLYSKINVSFIPGNINIVVANSKNAASWKTEGSDGTPGEDTTVNVSLNGYELIKLVEINAATSAMTISAFEAYIVAELGRQMAIAIEYAILNGKGSTANPPQALGILPGITWDSSNSISWPNASKIDYDTVVDGIALLPTMYHNNAVFIMNRKMLFGGIRKTKNQNGDPIFVYNAQDAAKNAILGYPVIVDDYMPDDTMIFGDPSYYYFNFSKPTEISYDKSVGFKSGKTTYRGLAVADGKPALSEAFVKIYKSTT